MQSQSQSQSELQKSKKRKHDENDDNHDSHTKAQPQHSNNDRLLQSGAPYFSAGEISFIIPQRKKLRLEFVRDAGIRAVAGTAAGDGAFAFGIGWANIGMFIFVLCVDLTYILMARGVEYQFPSNY